MATIELCEIRYPDKPARYFAEGKRISRQAFEALEIQARMFGGLDCFHSRAEQLPGGTFKRFNYKSARL